MLLAVEVSLWLPKAWQAGLLLQVIGTVIAGLALRGEWLDRTPVLPERATSERENPFKHGSTAASQPVRVYRPGLGMPSRPEYEAKQNAEQMKRRLQATDQETRGTLASDWEVQERTMRDLMDRSDTFLTAIRETQQATRRRVLWELLGLSLVTVGTFVSSPLFHNPGGMTP